MWQLLVGKIRPAASGDYGGDAAWSARRGIQSRAATSAGSEQSNGESARSGLSVEPPHCADEAVGQQLDVEAEVSRFRFDVLFLGRQQIHQQRSQISLS